MKAWRFVAGFFQESPQETASPEGAAAETIASS
jgi:hypothetical protein